MVYNGDMKIIEQIAEEAKKWEHNGYYYKLADMMQIAIVGLLSGNRTVIEIHSWAKGENIQPHLKRHFQIPKFPTYQQFLNILHKVPVNELNSFFIKIFTEMYTTRGKTISLDGKAVRSTMTIFDREKPLHIVSAFLAENNITIGSLAVDDKKNEIPAVQELLKLLDIDGAVIVTDSLNSQKKRQKS